MKLSVSNIAWNETEDLEIFKLLKSSEATGIEVAPTRIWPGWQGASSNYASQIKTTYADSGFKIPALQAILFDKPELHVFGDTDNQAELIDHLDNVASYAKAFGARVLVFGSPKNRDKGSLSNEQAFSLGADFFKRAGAACVKHDVQLCLEPNPSIYNCNFMTRWQDILNMVEVVSHPGIAVHLDTACISLEGDDIIEAIETCSGKIAHFHVTEPNLGDFSQPTLDHAAIGQALKKAQYEGWLSIEMRRTENPQKSVQEALEKVTHWYS
ncbi:sugar phosphate isomerase/epimerase family protein [Glaciecola sp. MF2-115]|uniref:sugar phosphate isomerase/epimerase family protein n=1 Tax=Glaciecola sp. MF2-115 TaxID=3384827 RepID=UPI0039A14D5D